MYIHRIEAFKICPELSNYLKTFGDRNLNRREGSLEIIRKRAWEVEQVLNSRLGPCVYLFCDRLLRVIQTDCDWPCPAIERVVRYEKVCFANLSLSFGRRRHIASLEGTHDVELEKKKKIKWRKKLQKNRVGREYKENFKKWKENKREGKCCICLESDINA